MTCEGPLIWYDVPPDYPLEGSAILECPCGYVIVSGNFNDQAHALTPVIREGLA